MNQHPSFSAVLLRSGATGLMLLALGACGSLPGQQSASEGDASPSRSDNAIVAKYHQCREQALRLDRQAGRSASPGQYFQSASLLESCEDELPPEVTGITRGERMRARALSVQNYLKAGDISQARQALERFDKAYPGHDLYYAEGASFRDSLRALLGPVKPEEYGRLSLLNASEPLKTEMRRVHYWTAN